MELGWGALALLCLAGLVAWFWQDSLGAREAANAAAMEACQRLSLQFLDGTVAFARLSLTRDAGRLKLRRTYVFDYTANSIERRQGFVVLAGAHVESVGYAPGDPSASYYPPRFSARSETTARSTPEAGTGHTVILLGEAESGTRQPRSERRNERPWAGSEPGTRAPDSQPVHIEFRAQFNTTSPARPQTRSDGGPAQPATGESATGTDTAPRRDSPSRDSTQQGSEDATNEDTGSSATNVLDLAQWRARNRRPHPDDSVADGNRKGS